MLSNFGNRKPDKDPTSPAEPPAAAPPPAPNGISRTIPASTARSDRPVASMIGPDLSIVGNLVSKGEVHIDGEVQGDIHGTNVLIGEQARITGGVVADDVVVRGQVMGSIRGKKVALQSTSHVEGDILHASLAIEQGAFFEGKSRRADDPTAGSQAVEMPPGTPKFGSASEEPATENATTN